MVRRYSPESAVALNTNRRRDEVEFSSASGFPNVLPVMLVCSVDGTRAEFKARSNDCSGILMDIGEGVRGLGELCMDGTKDGNDSAKRRLLGERGDQLPMEESASSEFELPLDEYDSNGEEGNKRGMRDCK